MRRIKRLMYGEDTKHRKELMYGEDMGTKRGGVWRRCEHEVRRITNGMKWRTEMRSGCEGINP
jgi:hypothetical protein